MLTQFNKDGIRVVGVVIAAFSGCLIYSLITELLAK
jgi:hypothetical protein